MKDKSQSKIDYDKWQKRMLEIANELGCSVPNQKSIFKWHSRARNKFIDELKKMANRNVAKKKEIYSNDSSPSNHHELFKARMVEIKLSSLSSVISSFELIKSSNALIIMSCINIAVSIGALIFTVLRVTGVIRI